MQKNMYELKNLNSKELEQYIIKKYPYIILIPEEIEYHLRLSYTLNLISDEGIYLDYEFFFPWKELSNLILNHNKNLVKPSPSEYSDQKEKIIDWYSYNTPIMSDPTITPAIGTALEEDVRNAEEIYKEWIYASYFLLYEYNIWNKAKCYSENKNSEFSSIEYKQAYYYIILRQFIIYKISINSFDLKNVYISDFKVNDIIYRELCEDLLYIILNLLLANKIIGNEVLENSLDNNDRFFEILKGIIKNHYDQNKDGYVCLKNLRRYYCDNYFSSDQIKNYKKKT